MKTHKQMMVAAFAAAVYLMGSTAVFSAPPSSVPAGFEKGQKKGFAEGQPKGWTEGVKEGWEGKELPPGLEKKQEPEAPEA